MLLDSKCDLPKFMSIMITLSDEIQIKSATGKPADSGAHATSYPMGTGGSFPGGKTARA
jgi:hypothetical protein